MQCQRCLNDGTVRNISFNEQGICNYCLEYDKIADQLKDHKRLEKLFINRINKIKGKYKYDVALGISGGKDSMYVLYQLINKYHLKVKTFTMNNGFLSDTAKKNINKMVKEFNVDHEYIEFDHEMLKNIYRYSMSHFLVPCIGCSYIGYAAMINYTLKTDAGMCIHGRSPEQMLRKYGNDVFTSFVNLGLKDIDDIDINSEYKAILDSISTKLDKNIKSYIEEILYDGIEGKPFREFVPYFLYHEYDEQEIIKFLKENTSWNPPKAYNHYDCEIHNAAKYIYQKAEGRAHRLPETSVLIRSNKITKEEGNKVLQEELIEKPTEELDRLFKFVGLNKNIILIKAKIYNWTLKK